MTITRWPNFRFPLLEVQWRDNGTVTVKKSRKLSRCKPALLLVSVALVTQFQAVYFPAMESDDA